MDYLSYSIESNGSFPDQDDLRLPPPASPDTAGLPGLTCPDSVPSTTDPVTVMGVAVGQVWKGRKIAGVSTRPELNEFLAV